MKITADNARILPAFEDTEALAAIIETFTTSTAEKATATAETLINTFGSFKSVLEADRDALEKATTKATAEKIAALLPIFRTYQHREAGKQIVNRRELEQYCKSLLYGEKYERFVVICVNAQCRVLGHKVICEGSLSEVNAYPRKVVEAALNYNAHSVFFSHNHPGGTCSPSPEDIKSTLQLQNALKAIGIQTLDHMIIAGENAYSMAQHGDINFG